MKDLITLYPKITDYNYISSAAGNALYSGISFEEFWWCMLEARNPSELDAGICAGIQLKELLRKN